MGRIKRLNSSHYHIPDQKLHNPRKKDQKENVNQHQHQHIQKNFFLFKKLLTSINGTTSSVSQKLFDAIYHNPSILYTSARNKNSILILLSRQLLNPMSHNNLKISPPPIPFSSLSLLMTEQCLQEHMPKGKKRVSLAIKN